MILQPAKSTFEFHLRGMGFLFSFNKFVFQKGLWEKLNSEKASY